MSVTQDFYAAVRSPNALDSLRSSVDRQLRAGATREQILSELEELRAALRRDDREADEDIVLEVMDFVTGWCSPHVRL